PGLDVDAHAADGVDDGERVGARVLRDASDRRDVGDVRREFDDQRLVGGRACGAYHAGRQIGIAGERLTLAGDVRTRDVQLDCGDRIARGHPLPNQREVV